MTKLEQSERRLRSMIAELRKDAATWKNIGGKADARRCLLLADDLEYLLSCPRKTKKGKR